MCSRLLIGRGDALLDADDEEFDDDKFVSGEVLFGEGFVGSGEVNDEELMMSGQEACVVETDWFRAVAAANVEVFVILGEILVEFEAKAVGVFRVNLVPLLRWW